jgi:hypothetical protein
VVNLLIVTIFLFPSVGLALDRCKSYTNEVRKYHSYYFGINFPWWYGVAQLQKESNCRDIISRDGVGSEGAPQITYRWWADKLAKEGVYDVKNRNNQLKAQAYINYDAYKKTKNYGRKLWVTFQIYNGGTLVLKEIDRAGVVDHSVARQQCKRKNITFNNGQVRNACDINYEYPIILYKYADKYRLGKDDDSFQYW